ncbi:MAG: hypothetical protein JST51_02355 [Armatimonadetes bacterium]|nr:hypothetical protein [Armatimonadota bacterium]
MTSERCSLAGFDGCIVLRTGDLKMVVTTEVGPRILYFGREGGPNMLLVRKEHAGQKGGPYRSYGGHRLWIGPEDKRKTCTSDSFPVEIEEVTKKGKRFLRLSSPVDEFHIQKTIEIYVGDGYFEIGHVVTNRGVYEATLAPWAITVMEPGGECLIPHNPTRPQADDNLLPIQNIALWGYTEMTDPRYTWGRKVIRLRSTDDPNPTKFGAFVTAGLAAYSNLGFTFVKRFYTYHGESLPDRGCNFESYTKAGMLEVESLAPLQTILPGKSSDTHVERWSLVEGTAPTGDDEAYAWLLNL